MNVTSDGERGLLGMVQLVQNTYAETMPWQDEGGLACLERALHHRRAPRAGVAGVRLFVAALATVALVGGGAVAYRQFDNLTYEVTNGSIGPGGFVRPTAAGTAILFSEGSEIALSATARARVDRLTANGGRVVVENGGVHARIVPRRHARWSVEAGPYTIRVTGTAFNVNWSWEDERLDVAMDHGSVVVTGPLAPSGVTLTGGMQLTVNPRSGLTIDGGTGGPATGSGQSAYAVAARAAGNHREELGDALTADEFALPLAAQPAASDQVGAGSQAPGLGADQGRAVAAPRPVAAGTGAEVTAAHHAWAERRSAGGSTGVPAGVAASDGLGRLNESWERQLADGNAQSILTAAEARGIDRVLVTVSGRELSALADAARYGHRPTLARRVLLSVRQRFPRGREARDAAFFLGGLAEDAGGPNVETGQATALEWYDRYLRESPRGRYVAQALGRKMVMTQKLQGNRAARSVAAEYLDRFPGGPYASAARKLAVAD